MPLEPPCRFEAVRDPADNWMVWDAQTDCPAEIQGVVLIGLNERDAYVLAQILEAGFMQRNELYDKPTCSYEAPLISSDLKRKLDSGWYFMRIQSNFHGISIRVVGRTRPGVPRSEIDSGDAG